MGRPPLPIGTFGRILFVDQPGGQIQARAKFRDYDGRVRLVSKSGRSRAAAERALKLELTVRQAPRGLGAVTSATCVEALADVWLEAPHGWSTGTARTYGSIARTHIKPSLGQLRLQEVSAGTVSRALKVIAQRSGPSAAKTARACLSGMFALAIEDGALAVNPVRASAAKIAVAKHPARALTRAETIRLTELFRGSDRAVDLDLIDLVDWMLATGCRIGEALSLRRGTNADGKPLLDLEAGTWEVNSTVVRVAGEGLCIQPRPAAPERVAVRALSRTGLRGPE